MNWPTRDLLNLIRWMLLGLFRSRTWLEAENLALRHQLNVLHRRSPKRPVFSNFDRLIFVCLYRIAPRILDAISIVEPKTVIRWHRAGFRSLWRWKSCPRAGRPQVSSEVRRLIREMSLPNPLWGAPRITESCSSSVDIGQTSVAKYIARRRRPPSRGWKTPESRARDRLNRPVRGPDDLLSAAVRVTGASTGSNASCGSASARIRLANGSRDKSPRHVTGRARHSISFVIATGSTARYSLGAFGP
jgi:hypothetical protein